MPKFQLTDIEVGISKLPETAINTPYVLTSDFESALMDAQPPPLPVLDQFTPDEVGDGNEWPEQLIPGYWQPMSPTIGGLLNTEVAARLAARALGGSVTNTAVTSTSSYDHTVPMQSKAQGRTPKLTTLVMALGGADFLYPSCAVNTWEATFDADSPVRYSAGLVNTGYWQRLADIDPAIVLPAPPDYHYMHPAATSVVFSNGDTVDFAADGRLLSGRCAFGNNVVTRALPGDGFIDSANRRSGAYRRDIHRGRRDAAATLKVSLDDALEEFVTMQSGTDVTSLSYLFRSDQKIAATSDYYEFEVKFPRAKIRVISPDTDGDDAALTLDFFVRRDTVSGGLATLRVRNGAATLA